MKRFYLMIAALIFSTAIFAQTGEVIGIVVDAETNEGLIGATVMKTGTSTGTVTDSKGNFSLNLPVGENTVTVSYVGFDPITFNVMNVTSGKVTDMGKVRLNASAIGLQGVKIIADRAKERETPVAFTTLNAKDMEQKLGSQDLPMVLNMTPSVYATMQGGGAGDARINVRGFNQRNVAIMINGVPVNDMENGWVYWSNWDGIADATSSIQMQRGLSAVNLATPSIGGTMNIITSPAEQKAGAIGKFEYGSGNFMKTTITGHTGMINDKYAVSAAVVRKVGEGVIDGVWTDAWAYYLGASYNVNSKNRLELYAVGAPQRHGQNLYKQNIGAYSQEYAESIDGYDPAASSKFMEANAEDMYETPFDYKDARGGRYYNENWSPVATDYEGQQWWNGKTRERYGTGFLNERENFYHKPIVNLNWYTTWSKKVSQFTTAYYSGGTGGGTGYLGSMKWNYHGGIDSPSRWIHYDKTIENNADTSFGILRNSRNDQNTYGILSKVKIDWNEHLKSQIGIDARTAKIHHYREVRDLLGGNFFIDDADEFNPNKKAVLGDKIDEDFTNNVNWGGAFFQTEWSKNAISAYGTVGYSMLKYDHTNHFMKAADGTSEFTLEAPWLSAMQAKGGLSYRITETVSVYANVGYVEKAPIVDAVINDRVSKLVENPSNETFISEEIGLNYKSKTNVFNANLNLYNTAWNDRNMTITDFELNGDEGIYVVTDLDAIHRGVELDFAYQPIKALRFDGAISLGDWFHTNNSSGLYKRYSDDSTKQLTFYTNDLKVGDAPQTQIAIAATVFPIKDLFATVSFRYYDRHWAAWNPDSRTDDTDTEQSWQAPAYSLLDFHAGYELPLDGKLGVQIFGHVFNILDALYIQDAVDNSKYNAYTANGKDHSADDAEVFLGLPRTFNVGIKLTFR